MGLGLCMGLGFQRMIGGSSFWSGVSFSISVLARQWQSDEREGVAEMREVR